MDDFPITLRCIFPIVGMNDLLDEILARQRPVRWITSEDAENFIGPTRLTSAHIDFIASQMGDRLGLFELSSARQERCFRVFPLSDLGTKLFIDPLERRRALLHF